MGVRHTAACRRPAPGTGEMCTVSTFGSKGWSRAGCCCCCLLAGQQPESQASLTCWLCTGSRADGEKEERVAGCESKSLGARRVWGAGFEGSESSDISSPFPRLYEDAGASPGVPAAWQCSSPSILHEAGAGAPVAFPSRSHPRMKLAAAWSHGLAAPADPRGQRFTMNF